MDAREERGLAIAKSGRVRQKESLWLVASQSGNGTYVVEPQAEEPSCTCPDYETRQIKCKHMWAVEYAIRRETNAKGETTVTESVRLTYRQEWPAYNAAQVHEKERVATILRDLCAAIDNSPQKTGRPRLPLSDAIFAAVMKVYGTTSGRRAQTDLREFAAKGYIDKAPCYNSVFKALENPELTPLLHALVTESAKPLSALEGVFNVDSTGFSTSEYRRWYSAKYGRDIISSVFLKAHALAGSRTHVIAAVEITDAYTHDSHMMKPLLARASKHFDIREVCADKAYLSARIIGLVDSIGAKAYIPFKKGSTGLLPDKFTPVRARNLWAQAFHFFMYQREEFLAHYHQRSNIETVFAMVKAKFGGRIRSKTPVAKVNEILCKVLCHNLCCLVSAFYELGVEAKFWQGGSVA